MVTRSYGLVLSSLLVLITPLPAVDLADLVGDWTLAEFSTPARLRETYYNPDTDTVRTSVDSSDFAQPGEILADAFYPNPVVTVTRNFTVDATGAVTGGETGQVLGISSNRLLYSDGTDQIALHSNTVGDILLASLSDIDLLEQTLCLKRPVSLATGDFAGDWFVVAMTSPADITNHHFEGHLSDVFYVGDKEVVWGDLSVGTDGNFSGQFSGGDPLAGTIAATGPGDAIVTTDEDPEEPISFKVNASKNVALATPGDSDEREYIVLVRKPDTLATAELAGTWRVSALALPENLVEVFHNPETDTTRQADSEGTANPGELLVDVYHPQKFELTRMQVEVDASGNFPGGTIVANGDTSVILTLDDGETVVFQPSADKTFMVAGQKDGYSRDFIVLVKLSDLVTSTFEEAVDLKPLTSGDRLILSWNGASNLRLEDSSTLSGWAEVEEAAGSDTYSADLSAGGARFFRVAERASEDSDP